MSEPTIRQQVLQLWLQSAALDTGVAAWAFHDGTDGAGPGLPEGSPPYRTGLDALRDGWFLIAVPGPTVVEDVPGELAGGFTFERRVTLD